MIMGLGPQEIIVVGIVVLVKFVIPIALIVAVALIVKRIFFGGKSQAAAQVEQPAEAEDAERVAVPAPESSAPPAPTAPALPTPAPSADPTQPKGPEPAATLAQVLKTHREKHHMTQELVAQSLGVSRQAVSKWESGASEPCTTNLIAIAKLFGTTASELLHEVGE